jgi:hypothetical protein
MDLWPTLFIRLEVLAEDWIGATLAVSSPRERVVSITAKPADLHVRGPSPLPVCGPARSTQNREQPNVGVGIILDSLSNVCSLVYNGGDLA